MESYFVVQHDTLADGWINTWSNSAGAPLHFESRETAEQALEEFFADLREEVALGNIGPYERAEFRVVQLYVV